MFARRHAIADTRPFLEFRPPMAAIPDRVVTAIGRGVQSGTDCPFSAAGRLIDPAGDGLTDAVVRNSDGVLVVACQTDMPRVTPEMWDWWFGWHGLASERYRLWHPKEHLGTTLAEDRSRFASAKDRYIGNTSFVSEHIGDGEVHKLAITFHRPADFGIDEAKLAPLGTAICARGGLDGKFVDVSYLIHFVRSVPGGSQMLSRFWLGHVESKLPLVGPLISRRMNSRKARVGVTPDAFGLHLLRHCSEEMNHLAGFLPELFAKHGQE